MNDRHYKRKISAILSADVAGYSRLMGDDEDATVRTLTSYRNVISDLVQQHHGQVIDSPGDNLLAEFSSVVDALRCGWDVQKEIEARNSELPENRRMNYRIGINLGDVIEEEGRIYGDGVNVAARLESLAEAGGINISGSAYDQVKSKLSYRFEYQGEQPVKNIKDPVRSYRVVMTSEAAGTRPRTKKAELKRPVLKVLLLGAAIAVLFAGFAVWVYMHTRSLSRSHMGDAPGQQIADKASIAVLPFKNLSENLEQEYFSDGITNDIITDLSRFRYLLVISGNTTFTYKGKAVSAVAVGRELSVRYVLEGSVQRAGDTVRVNAQLIDASSGAHIWAERYVRSYEDIFKLQGEVVQAIVARLAIKTFEFEQARAMRKQPQDLKAYDYLLRGWAHYQRRNRVSIIKAGEMFSKAVALDPHYADAYAGLGWVDAAKVIYGWTEFPDKALTNAYVLGRKALDLDESNASAHALLTNVYAFQNQYELAIRAAERAIELNPNDSYSYAELGFVLLWSGRVDEAISALEMSLRLDTNSPWNARSHLGMAYYLKGQYKKALNILEKGVIKRPEFAGNHIALAATYARLGRTDAAAQAADTVRRLDPFFEIDTYGTAFRNPTNRDAIVEGLRKAGLK